jgi:hypothetical protein
MSVILSDYDGTWSNIGNLWGDIDAIITGRSYQEFQDLKDEYIGPDKPIYFNPSTSQENNASKIVLHKAEMINKMKAIRFYEDQKDEVLKLRLLCPSCKIIWVREGITAI